MGRSSKIWRNKLEQFVDDLHFQKRKDCSEIAEIIKKEKKINISREAVRRYINSKVSHNNTSENTV